MDLLYYYTLLLFTTYIKCFKFYFFKKLEGLNICETQHFVLFQLLNITYNYIAIYENYML